MESKIVYQGQTFLDKVIECTGSIENAFAMSVINGFPMTTDLEIGAQVITAPVTNKRIAAVFNDKNRPATANTVEENIEVPNYEFPGEFPFSF